MNYYAFPFRKITNNLVLKIHLCLPEPYRSNNTKTKQSLKLPNLLQEFLKLCTPSLFSYIQW